MAKKTLAVQIVLCGRGGQGILFLTRLLDEVALSLGHNVISSEIHGMAMRGSSVASHIRIGEFYSPLIRSGQGDILIALSESEVPFNTHLLKKGNGQIYVNSPDSKQGAIHAEKIAEDLDSPVVANLVLLGFACGHPEFPFAYERVKDILKKMSPPRVMDLNSRALMEGYRTAKK
jgi:indolepyruvate ferredoxin oxidoreductase beta subunit